MKQITVQINGKARIAKLEISKAVWLENAEDLTPQQRRNLIRYVRKNGVGMMVTIDGESKFVYLARFIFDNARAGDKFCKKIFRDEILRVFNLPASPICGS